MKLVITLSCGHVTYFHPPAPRVGTIVYCYRCRAYSPREM